MQDGGCRDAATELPACCTHAQPAPAEVLEQENHPFAFLPPSCPAHQAAEECSPAQLLVELRIHAFKSLISLLSPALAVRWAFFCMRN